MTAGDNNQHVDLEDLSAYADGEALSQDQRLSIEHHLAGCPACRDELASLQAVSALLADLPAPEAPRSFRLTPADVGDATSETSDIAEPVPIEPWIVRNQSRFRWAGLAAAVLLMMVITADLFSTTSDDDAVSDLTFMEDAAEESAPVDEDLDEAPSIMSVEEAEDADELAVEEDAPDAVQDGEVPDAEEFPVAEDEAAPEDSRLDQPDPEFAPDDEAGADDGDHPVADTAAEEEMTTLHTAEETDGGLSLLQWTGIVLAVLTAALLGAGFLLPRFWPSSPRSSQ